MARRLAHSRQFNSYGTMGARNSGTGIAQVFLVEDSAVTVGEVYLFTNFNYDGLLGPGFDVLISVSIHEVNEGNYPIGDALVSDTFNVSDGVLAGGNDAGFKVYKHTVSLPLELEANKNYALVMLSINGRVVYWVRFRTIGWLSGLYPKVMGSSNYVIVKLSEDEGETWNDWTQDYMCFEIWGAVIPTSVTTNPATLVTGTTARINGTLTNDGGEASDCSFEWGLTDDYGETTTPVSKVTGETFSADIIDLVPGTTYHFRAKAVNSLGTFYGADRTFNSSGSAYPSVTTTRVSSLVHRWTPGSFTLEMVLGGITSEFDLIIPTGKPTPTIPMVPTVPTLPSCQSDEMLTWSLERGYYCMKISDIPLGRF